MKDADKRARQTVALGGLVLLQHNYREDSEHATSRKHLVALPKGEENDPAFLKAVRSKSWLRDYVKRLVDAGILKRVSRDDQDMYQPANVDELEALIHDHEEPNYGLRLSQFLFPSEAGLPVELRGAKDESDDTEGDEDAPVAPVSAEDLSKIETDEKMVLIHGSTLRDIRQSISDLSDLVATPSQLETELLPYMRNRHKELEKRLDAIEKAVNGQGGVDVSRTLARIDAGVASLISGMGVIGAKVEKIDVTTFAGIVQAVVDTALGFSGNPAQPPSLRQMLQEALDKYQSQSNLRETLAELRAKVKDLGAVEELALKAVEESEAT